MIMSHNIEHIGIEIPRRRATRVSRIGGRPIRQTKEGRTAMKRFSLIAFVACIGVFFVFGGFAQAAETYRIGGIFPLTGALSWLGEYKKKGAELKVELINKAGGVNGHKLELISYDDQSSPETASRAAQRLVSKDRVIAMIGTASVPVSGAVASIGAKSKIPVIIGSGYEVNAAKEPFLFNSAHKTDFAVARPFQYFQSKGITKVALLMPIGPLGELGSSLARKYAPNYKIEIVGEEKFDVKAADVTSQLAKLRGLDPQAVFSFCTGEPAALVARNMDQMGMKIPVLVSHGNANPGFLKFVSTLTVPIVVPGGRAVAPEIVADSDPCKKIILEFSKAHQAKYGEPANYYSAEMVDAVDLIAAGLKATGSGDTVKLRAAIEEIKGFAGMNGVYNFSPTDHHGTVMSDMMVFGVKDAKWAVLLK
jgi:branched-chain amino acid transport system substrate-binding protein